MPSRYMNLRPSNSFLKIIYWQDVWLLTHAPSHFYFQSTSGMVVQKQPSEVFCKVFLEILQNSQENTESFFNKVAGLRCNFIKKENLAQVFSCEFSEISKNTLFTEHLWATASYYVSETFIKVFTQDISDKLTVMFSKWWKIITFCFVFQFYISYLYNSISVTEKLTFDHLFKRFWN